MDNEKKKPRSVCADCEDGAWCTKIIPLFSDLPQDLQQSLAERSIQTTREKGETLFRVGEEVGSVLIIRRGRIKLCKYDADGNEYILDILHDGDAIWENLFLENAVFPYSAVCLTAVELCEIRKSDFIRMLADRPAIAMNLISLLTLRLQDANEKALLLSIRDPEVRLAGFLLDRDIRCVGPEISLKLEDIAASIGLRPETVSRNLSKFEKARLIRRLGQGRILVTDRAGLKKVYESDP